MSILSLINSKKNFEFTKISLYWCNIYIDNNKLIKNYTLIPIFDNQISRIKYKYVIIT